MRWRTVQAVLLLVGGAAAASAVVSYFAPGLDGVVNTVVLLSPVLLAVVGPYALHWLVVRAPVVAVPTAAGFAIWGVSFAIDVTVDKEPAEGLFSWFFLVLVQFLAVVAAAAVGGVVSAATGAARAVSRRHGEAEPAAAPASRPTHPAAFSALATAVVVLLVGGGFFAGRVRESSAASNRHTPPSLSTADVPAPAGVAPEAAVDAAARSLSFEGDIVDLSTVHLRGDLTIYGRGSVSDAAGRPIGRGLLRAEAADVTVAGDGLRFTAQNPMIVTAAGIRFPNDEHRSTLGIATASGPMRIDAGEVELTDDAGGKRTVAGPVSLIVEAEGVNDHANITADGAVEWVDPPSALHLSSRHVKRATLSWAGTGVVQVAGREYDDEFLGVKTKDDFDATVSRAAGGVTAKGTGHVAQIYAGGTPRLLARGGVRVKSSGVRAGAGRVAQFTWAPENVGDTDMVISSIRAVNDAGRWVSLGLDTLPRMCGGERCPEWGGDTSGLKRGDPINAVILPNTGDERDIRFAVPRSQPAGPVTMTLELDGNFDRVRVEVPVTIE